MKYLSVCSGIEAATVAWHPLGWEPLAFSEIEKFPRAVLQHHYPEVPLHGDFTTIGNEYGKPDILVGGTPCQSFSIAGLRKGMDDERGNLALEYLKLAERLGAKWLVWENVPGVLSSNGGRDFGSFLGGLVELGYGFAYRVLDAFNFGTPIRRRRVYVVAGPDWRSAAAVLFESESLKRNIKKVQRGNLFCIDTGVASYDRSSKDNILIDEETNTARLVTPEELEMAMGFGYGYTDIKREEKTELKNEIRDNSTRIRCDDGKTRESVCPLWWDNGKAGCRSLPPDRKSSGNSVPSMQHKIANCRGYGVGDACMGLFGRRRITPDGPRYKALGNSMAVPVMNWIGQRIRAVEEIIK